MNTYGLGYGQLNKDEQVAYGLFEEAMRRQAASCDISRVKRNVNIMEVLATVLGDNPDIIYFNKTMIRTIGSFYSKQMNFVGCLNKRQAEQCGIQLKKALENAVWEIDKNAKNDKEILMGISEFLQRNVKYDTDELKSIERGKSRTPMSHNAYGALVNHLAVCDGFASAFSLIAQYFGMKGMLVKGKSSYRHTSKVDHVWNIMEYQGEFFHIDATWDTNTYETTHMYSYDYFGLDDDEIAVDHEWDFRSTPKCGSQKLSYFIANHLYAYSESQIEDIISKHIKYRNKTMQLKISPAISMGSNPLKYLEEKIMSAASRSGYTSQFYYTWQEATRCLTITLA